MDSDADTVKDFETEFNITQSERIHRTDPHFLWYAPRQPTNASSVNSAHEETLGLVRKHGECWSLRLQAKRQSGLACMETRVLSKLIQSDAAPSLPPRLEMRRRRHGDPIERERKRPLTRKKNAEGEENPLPGQYVPCLGGALAGVYGDGESEGVAVFFAENKKSTLYGYGSLYDSDNMVCPRKHSIYISVAV
ncbi:hypothetical protein CCUS01_06569 [Colletotrichum cuscutae]|uniref:Uncharacterized protein n=1 Tax=Colletotrichum cuscutae TaxID=1209917 RepID=A0AAI9V9I5_9PEZI|nr:hypothetical protein CCUS01_06569 [Colletotrichum cuscutae]